jgi:hypothetical protein
VNPAADGYDDDYVWFTDYPPQTAHDIKQPDWSLVSAGAFFQTL